MRRTERIGNIELSMETVTDHLDQLLDERELSRLHWRCRRGLLENDLFVERFFQRFESLLTRRDAAGLTALMDLPDNDLLDLLLRRTEPSAAINTPELRSVLERMRQRTA
jgi:antitoxin CptB